MFHDTGEITIMSHFQLQRQNFKYTFAFKKL